MPIPRKEQINIETTPYYHCISRCVRQAYLCGFSKVNNKNYEHRRHWVVERLQQLAEVFAIKVCSYAVMSNHYHLVLCVDKQQAENWTTDEVTSRWNTLFKGHYAVDAAKSGEKYYYESAGTLIESWRERLTDISWFMRCMNEHIARRANKEDHCTGRFWEGRYKSQALLDEAALLTCMAYVDLNPVRAQASKSLEDSDFTSVQQRLKKTKSTQKIVPLMPFSNQTPQPESESALLIPFCETDYLELVHWTGQAVREDKPGFIPQRAKLVLERAGVNEGRWVESVKHFGSRYGWLAGRIASIRQQCTAANKKWLRGVRTAQADFIAQAA